MLHSKIIHCPETPEDVALAALPLAKMAMDYSIELGIGTAIFDTETFIKGWMEGTEHVLGFYADTELVGMVLGNTQTQMFTNAITLTAHTAYINREHRQEGAIHVNEAIAATKAYCKSVGVDRLIIHADPRMVKGMEKQNGKLVYAAVEFDL